MKFGRDPHNVTCDCCGGDYVIDEYKNLEDASSFHRKDQETVDQYLQRDDVLFISKNELSKVFE